MRSGPEEEKKNGQDRGQEAPPARAMDFNDIKQSQLTRIKTNISEVDRVLGGGIVPGSVSLLSGEPGIGKSTLAAQMINNIDKKGSGNMVYVSGEESPEQVKSRLARLGCKFGGLKFVSNTNVERFLATVKKVGADLVIIDSIQTVYTEDVASEPGSITQIRATASKILEFAKENNIAVLLIGHITKDGQLAGPKSLEHIVDTVLYLESELTEKSYCLLRGTKNRFGSVNEIGVLEMTGSGFQEITNSSSIFLEAGADNISGSIITCIMDGNKPFFVDVQALTTKTVFGYPQRRSSGLDVNRLQVLASVLSKRTGFNLVNQDIVLNIVGGLKVADPALDLPACLAIISSFVDKAVPRTTLVVGEVGLGGEIRNVSRLDTRLKEAKRLGFDRAIIPGSKQKISANMDIKRVRNIKEAVSYL
jgi:DNA repair protein RadA/Sms